MRRALETLALAMVVLGASAHATWAMQAQPVPVPEQPSTSPQIEVDGVGVGTLGSGGPAGAQGAGGGVNFSDSALFLGAAQRLYDGGIGSIGFGELALDAANGGVSSPLFLYQAFADYQSENLEVLLGRSDNRTAHLVDFPTLRGDDLVTLTNPLDPFSNGQNTEEHRYANVASLTLNQGLAYFEDFHVQHLIDSLGTGTDARINSAGASFQYLSPPGMEAFERFPSWGASYEYVPAYGGMASALNQLALGGVMNLNESITDRFDLRAQDILSVGSALTGFRSVTDSYQANSNDLAMSLRYLHSPFGSPGYQLALTAGLKNYLQVADSASWGWALTGVKRLGQGFDLVAQYQGQWRGAGLAAVQSAGAAYVQTAEVGLVFNFGSSSNAYIAPRRSLLNQQHHYIP